MIRSAYIQVPSQRQELRLECPKCCRYNLIQSEDPDIYYTCPDPECGYIIWARPPTTLNP